MAFCTAADAALSHGSPLQRKLLKPILWCLHHGQAGQGRADTLVMQGRAGQGRAGQGKIQQTPYHARNMKEAAKGIDRQRKQYAHLVDKPTHPYHLPQ